MRFIVTGGSGFVGTNLIKKLAELYPEIKIYNLDIRFENNYVSKNIVNYKCDITKETELQNFNFLNDDIIFHLAANIFNEETPYISKRKEFFEKLNVHGTENLLNVLKRDNVKKIVFLSTCMVYGTPKKKLIKTDHQLKPNGPYGSSKLKAENLILKFGEENDSKCLIYRASIIAGPGRMGLLKKLSFLIKNNLPVPMIGTGKNRYQMISVHDCVEALINFIKLGYPTGIYNLGSKNPPTVRVLLKSLIKSSGSKSVLIPTWPYGIKKILYLLDLLNMTLLYPEQYLLAQHEFVLDIEDLENELDFKPVYQDEDLLLESYLSILNNQST